jgi:hypothetical protein
MTTQPDQPERDRFNDVPALWGDAYVYSNYKFIFLFNQSMDMHTAKQLRDWLNKVIP